MTTLFEKNHARLIESVEDCDMQLSVVANLELLQGMTARQIVQYGEETRVSMEDVLADIATRSSDTTVDVLVHPEWPLGEVQIANCLPQKSWFDYHKKYVRETVEAFMEKLTHIHRTSPEPIIIDPSSGPTPFGRSCKRYSSDSITSDGQSHEWGGLSMQNLADLLQTTSVNSQSNIRISGASYFRCPTGIAQELFLALHLGIALPREYHQNIHTSQKIKTIIENALPMMAESRIRMRTLMDTGSWDIDPQHVARASTHAMSDTNTKVDNLYT